MPGPPDQPHPARAPEQLPWRRPSDNAAEQLARRAARVPLAPGFTANVIEGEYFDDTRDPAPGTV
jgi:hypothetical protein